ncbi:hypothetical protein RB195_008644 [Necator americanus]|uniref:Galectin n=1 Tax=Necator americanus TaxID=51031 RepID=A0ABR1CPM0_NECAM
MYNLYADYMKYVERNDAEPAAPAVSKFSNEVFNPTNPVELPVNGFGSGHRLRVVLKTLDKRDMQFWVNLKDGDDILLHFNPRLKDEVIVFNVFTDGEWQHEERPSIVFPFQRDQIYTIELVATTDNSALIYVNGRFLYEFRQRESGQRASSVEVDGDVFIHSVHVT